MSRQSLSYSSLSDRKEDRWKGIPSYLSLEPWPSLWNVLGFPHSPRCEAYSSYLYSILSLSGSYIQGSIHASYTDTSCFRMKFKKTGKWKLLVFPCVVGTMYLGPAEGRCSEQGITHSEAKIARGQRRDAVVPARHTRVKKANITLAHKESEKCIIWDPH